ncbi:MULTISPECIES: hypothetical protein [unclassified Kitasatospora]|uniref:hypothetical protein n=1 Tax=unclassified Kitasatospora TaxID=2633591 RepID=UPI00381239F6
MDQTAAKLLALDRVGVRTLERWERKRRRFGVIGCADDRWLRESGGHPSISEEVREAILTVREETRHHRSKVDARTRETMIHRYVRETFPGQEIKVPSYDTLTDGSGTSGSAPAVVGSATNAPRRCPRRTGTCWSPGRARWSRWTRRSCR